MFSMPASSRETEPATHEDQDFLVHTAWFLWFIVFAYIGIVLFILWQDVEVRLYGLHTLTRFFQAVARTAGSYGLMFEQGYNDYIELLH